jgi:atypical dual specificity phosphatase
MATTSVLEQPKQRHIFARRFLELVIPPKIKQPSPNFYDSQNLAMFFYTELSEISEILTDSLYLSGCSPVTSDNLESLGITAVVCALSEAEERRMMGERTLPDSVKKMYVRLIDADSSDISAHFDRAGQFIEAEIRAGGRVLVHCAAGISRSSSLVLAYLMRYRNHDLRKAFGLVKSVRRVVRPNNGFFQNLIDYERSILGDDRAPSVRMVRQNEDENDNCGDVRLVPDVVLEHAKRIEMNDWRHLG